MTPTSSSPIRPLSIGKVVSAGVSLYRTNFKTYTGLGVKAMLWYLVPIYGWAKLYMILGQIGRLGFQELIQQPESVSKSLDRVSPRLWSFWGIAILIGLIQFGINLAISIVGSIITVPTGLVLGGLGEAGVLIASLINLIVQIVSFGVQIWFQARFWIYDLIIAVETDEDPVNSIGRSWKLSQGSAFRVQGVLLVTYLLMLPLFVISFIPLIAAIPLFIQLSGDLIDVPSSELGTVFALLALAFLVFIILLLVVSIFAMPFFQTIKAVLYYDLRSRREGFDIQLADRRR